jgi:CAAX protease family protein
VTDQAAPPREDGRPQPIAPYRHTAILVALFLLLTVGGVMFQGQGKPDSGAPAQHPPVATLYLSLLVLEWGLVFYVWRGLRRSGTKLRDLIRGRWSSPWDVLRDGAVALGAWVVWVAIQTGWDLWMSPGHAKSVDNLLPHGMVEIALWVALSLSAGFCEELVFRGYLLRQFAALTRSNVIGLILQAALFGVSHGYQGAAATVEIGLFGVVYGILAQWRRSLRPVMIAHAWSDIWSGWLGLL